jgi:hypothetical protein
MAVIALGAMGHDTILRAVAPYVQVGCSASTLSVTYIDRNLAINA